MNIVKPNDRTTLLLNAAWLPINLTTARAALNHTLTGRVGAIDRFGNVHNMPVGGATHANLESSTWFGARDVFDGNSEFNIEDSPYYEDQPVLRSTHGAWPIPTVVLTGTRFFRRSKSSKPSIQTLAKIYKNTCQICLKRFPTKELTMEHVYPKSKGGTLDQWNVLPTCKECNTLKADIFPYYDVEGNLLEDKIKGIPHYFIVHAELVRDEWEQFLIAKRV